MNSSKEHGQEESGQPELERVHFEYKYKPENIEAPEYLDLPIKERNELGDVFYLERVLTEKNPEFRWIVFTSNEDRLVLGKMPLGVECRLVGWNRRSRMYIIIKRV